MRRFIVGAEVQGVFTLFALLFLLVGLALGPHHHRVVGHLQQLLGGRRFLAQGPQQARQAVRRGVQPCFGPGSMQRLPKLLGQGTLFGSALAALGAAVTVCVATELGAEEQGCADGITVRTGRLDAEGMTALLRGAALCVDATHPYAAEATRNIRAAAAAAGVEYHRLLRPASPLPAGSVVLADAARAAAYLADRPGRVLLATGAKELPAFAALDPARLYPRVLPTLAGIAACEAAGVPHRNILAMQGPFTKELNAALLHQFHIDYMVTKDGGAAGGFAEKAEAAARCGVQLIVLRRPDDAGETADTILQRCRELL